MERALPAVEPAPQPCGRAESEQTRTRALPQSSAAPQPCGRAESEQTRSPAQQSVRAAREAVVLSQRAAAMPRPVWMLLLVAARPASGAALRGLTSSTSSNDDYSNIVLLALAAALALCCTGSNSAVRGAVGSTLRRVTVRNTVEPAPLRSSSSSSKELAPQWVAAASSSKKAGQVGQIVLGQYPPTREVDKLYAPQYVGQDKKPEDSERARDSQRSGQVEPTRARESRQSKPEDPERARDSQQSGQVEATPARESRQSKQTEPKRDDEEPLEEKDDLSDDSERVEAASEAAAPKPDRDGAP